jgi:hypothetical protein
MLYYEVEDEIARSNSSIWIFETSFPDILRILISTDIHQFFTGVIQQ